MPLTFYRNLHFAKFVALLLFMLAPLAQATEVGNTMTAAMDSNEAQRQEMQQQDIQDSCVILLHGLGRTSGSMKKIEKALAAEGYRVWNEGYDSRSATIEDLAEGTITNALTFCSDHKAARIHFVTHSLGGILVRQYFQQGAADNIGRIVMLSPPNHGSEVADALNDKIIVRRFLGKVGKQLSRDKSSFVNSLQPIAIDIGIITGNRSSDPWFSPLIPGEDDGKVSVESAKLPQMKDFLVLPYGHTTIMKKPEVITQIKHFLERGSFHRAESAASESP